MLCDLGIVQDFNLLSFENRDLLDQSTFCTAHNSLRVSTKEREKDDEGWHFGDVCLQHL
jgi:hypothetical protein